MSKKQLPTLKVTYVKKNEKNGKAPLAIRATLHQKNKMFWLGFEIENKHFDNVKGLVNKQSSNYDMYNRIIKTRLSEIELSYLQQLSKGIPIELNPTQEKDNSTLTFSEVSKLCCDSLKNKCNELYIKRLQSVCDEFTEFAGNIKFSQINFGLLNNFEQHLLKNKNSTNTINRKYKWIKQIANFANRHYDINIKVFNLFKVAGYQNPVKQYLTIEEINLIENINPSKIAMTQEIKSKLNVSLETFFNIHKAFLASCYTSLRYSDLQKFDYASKVIENNGQKRVILSTQKTGSIVSIAINETIDKMLASLKPLPSNAQVNKALKCLQKIVNINKSITFHMARHSFATNALNKGARIEIISDIMGHTDLRTTKIYAKVANPARDEAVALLHPKLPFAHNY